MKDFKFRINGNEYKVEIQEIIENIAHIEVNGAKYQVELEKKIETPKVVARKPIQKVAAQEPVANTSKPAGGQTKSIKSPLPGTILDIKVRQGDIVKKGTTLLLLEAMKMENNITSDFDGTISSIKFNKGESVLEGAVLVEITI